MHEFLTLPALAALAYPSEVKAVVITSSLIILWNLLASTHLREIFPLLAASALLDATSRGFDLLVSLEGLYERLIHHIRWRRVITASLLPQIQLLSVVLSGRWFVSKLPVESKMLSFMHRRGSGVNTVPHLPIVADCCWRGVTYINALVHSI